MLRLASTLSLVILLCSFSPAAGVNTPQVTFTWNSDVGDPVGQGSSGTLTEDDGVWDGERFSSNRTQTFEFDEHAPGFDRWNFEFCQAGGTEFLQPSTTYLNAEKCLNPPAPGVYVSRHTGCNMVAGEFTILDVQHDWWGDPVR